MYVLAITVPLLLQLTPCHCCCHAVRCPHVIPLFPCHCQSGTFCRHCQKSHIVTLIVVHTSNVAMIVVVSYRRCIVVAAPSIPSTVVTSVAIAVSRRLWMHDVAALLLSQAILDAHMNEGHFRPCLCIIIARWIHFYLDQPFPQRLSVAPHDGPRIITRNRIEKKEIRQWLLFILRICTTTATHF